MKKLTKKYRVVYSDNEIILNPYEEYSDDSETAVGEGRIAVEFDTINEVEKFIEEKRLTYTDI